MEGLYELTNALSNGTIPDPLRPPLRQDWGFATPPKSSIAIISGTDFKSGRYIHRVHPNKSPLKIFGGKGACPIFKVPPIISGMGKATNFKFCSIFTGSIGTKVH